MLKKVTIIGAIITLLSLILFGVGVVMELTAQQEAIKNGTVTAEEAREHENPQSPVGMGMTALGSCLMILSLPATIVCGIVLLVQSKRAAATVQVVTVAQPAYQAPAPPPASFATPPSAAPPSRMATPVVEPTRARQDFKIHGKMLVKNFKAAFYDQFGVGINVHKGFSMGHYADDGDTLASIRSASADAGSGELELHGNMKVGTAEKAVKESLGFAVQILNKSGANADNSATLASLR